METDSSIRQVRGITRAVTQAPGAWPDFANFGVLLRALLIAHALALVCAASAGDDWAGIGAAFMAEIVVLEPALATCLGLWVLSARWLRRSGRLAWIVAGALALVGALAVRAALAAYFDVPDTARVIAFTLSAVALIAYDASLRHAALAPSLTQARLMALNRRIRPHFLFNSLNAVLGIVRNDPRRAETALEELAELYRVLMRDHDGLVRLSDEIALGRRYLDLEKLRLGERLRVDWEIDAVPPDARVPPLLLQPLLENAVYHGVEPSSVPALVRVGLRRAAGQIEIEISNPYHGEAAHGGGQHMAVANIRERLRLYFDLAGTLAQDVRAGRYRVQLRFPYTTGSDDDE